MDVTTNTKKNRIINILVNALQLDETSSVFLFCSERLIVANAKAIVNVLKDTVVHFDIQCCEIVIVTDRTATMRKTDR